MRKDLSYIEGLVAKFQKGAIAPEELSELVAWYNTHLDDEVHIPITSAVTAEEIKKRMLDRVLVKIHSEEMQEHRPVRSLRLWYRIAGVAVLCLMFISVLWIAVHRERQPSPINAEKMLTDSILPGGNKAILMLADGTEVVLDAEQQGIIMDDNIHYVDGRQLDKKLDLSEVKTLQLYVPKGGIYQITLDDGTQVWLNSDTRLKYPSKFSATERVVELDGEAFFDVKSLSDTDSRKVPFIVKSRGQFVEVLGTQFNINTYVTDPFVKTTLVEGKVNVHVGNDKITLLPGHQASTRGDVTNVRKVHTPYYTAWKEGKFNFDGKSFEETLAEIGRWYNLSIVYRNGVPKVELVGDAYRNENIKLVLRLLDASDISYKLDIATRTLIIY